VSVCRFVVTAKFRARWQQQLPLWSLSFVPAGGGGGGGSCPFGR